MRRLAQQQKEVPLQDAPGNTVFWSIVAVISIFVVVLAAVMIVRTGTTGRIVYIWESPTRPAEWNPMACLDMPPCGSDQSFLCCAENPLPGIGIKCMAPVYGYTSEPPQCPAHTPYACSCPEKFQYRQTWPVPAARKASYE